MFCLGIDPDVTGRGLAELPRVGIALLLDAVHEGQDLLESWNLELPVEARVTRPRVRNALARTQRFELSESEVLRKPSGNRIAVDDLVGTRGRKPGMTG